MKPERANQDLKGKVIKLNDVFQNGQRAKEFSQTEYWQQLSQVLADRITAHEGAKRDVNPLLYKVGFTVTKQDGSTYHKSGDEALTEAIAAESEIQVMKDLIDMVKADINNGSLACQDLEKIKNRVK